jgi:ATP-dependent Lhr-like helicase
MTGVDPALRGFHPLVQQWFSEALGTPSLPQQRGWPAIARGVDTLILAPTGTGKTLTAFLYEVDTLIREGQSAPLANAVHLLYVSPLKALSNDVQRNLDTPLAELRTRFGAAGEVFPEIRVAVRTGDTSSAARARMIRRTPHILITTPESLHLLLTSTSGRSMFSALRGPSAAPTWRSRWNACAPCRRARRNGSDCRRRSAPSTRSPASWAGVSRRPR